MLEKIIHAKMSKKHVDMLKDVAKGEKRTLSAILRLAVEFYLKAKRKI